MALPTGTGGETPMVIQAPACSPSATRATAQRKPTTSPSRLVTITANAASLSVLDHFPDLVRAVAEEDLDIAAP